VPLFIASSFQPLPALFLQGSSAASNPLIQGLPIVLIFGIFYFLLFLPMQKQKKAQKKMLEDLKNGDVVLTSGGIIGSILAIDGDTVVLRVKPDNLKMQFARSAVSSLVPTETSK
jgi:preprotein translocase subunit YajC